ncbi:penicillin acylase family protein [Siphonobacter sp. BAB-5405]|uniref:penicillin acylase family protein n=1 Tax=Siphonobacter sp. BAB-5405 TaxID=1864825 RepID=UPI0026879456
MHCKRLLLGIIWILGTLQAMGQSATQTLKMPGLQQSVEIIRDQWGVSHIYAKNDHDLFFAQGYVAATDRLFQLELWRRQATGTVAEWLGPSELKRDLGTRLFKFRQNLDQEFAHYHPRGKLIITAYTAGVNARIAEVRKDTSKLSFEFKLLKSVPGFWTPEVVISRHQGLIANLTSELSFGRQVHVMGEEKTRELNWFHPTRTPASEPKLTLEKGVDGAALMQDILGLYNAFRAPLRFKKPGSDVGKTFDFLDWYETEKEYVGSNNWTLSGEKSQSHFPMLANDPHRTQSTPSLRYWIHLNAPGWNVVGAGEPTLPGVSIGHNDYGAWGLTISGSDCEDLYVYDLNPQNPNQYRYKGQWVAMKIVTDTIPVKGQQPQVVQLKYTRHGPVVFEDAKANKAYAVRAGWMDVGCAPYLASLRMNQSKSWDEFREACSFARLPSLNMIWADRKGHIGWQVSTLAPIRPNWSGLVPVPGDGRFEWEGYLPIQQLPHLSDPAKGFIASANSNLTSPDYQPRTALGWEWSTPYRTDRLEEVLGSSKRFNLSDFSQLQNDVLSIPARTLVPLLKFAFPSNEESIQKAVSLLQNWDFRLNPESIEAAIYVEWENQLRDYVYEKAVPKAAQAHFRKLSTKVLIDYLLTPPPEVFGSTPLETRNQVVTTALQEALTVLTKRLGKDSKNWAYGQTTNKHITITHAFSDWVSPAMQQKINLGPIARGGNAETINNSGNTLNQTHGASFRILVDTENWDKTLGVNSPGQSENPEDPHYRDLFDKWNRGEYFPVYFNKEKIKSVADRTTLLTP